MRRTEIDRDLVEVDTDETGAGVVSRVDFDFASVTEWQFAGRWRLVSLNLT